MLNNVDTICDFQESQLYKHMKFQEVENPYTEEMKKELLEGFRNAEEFVYMKEYEPWKNCYQGIKIMILALSCKHDKAFEIKKFSFKMAVKNDV